MLQDRKYVITTHEPHLSMLLKPTPELLALVSCFHVILHLMLIISTTKQLQAEQQATSSALLSQGEDREPHATTFHVISLKLIFIFWRQWNLLSLVKGTYSMGNGSLLLYSKSVCTRLFNKSSHPWCFMLYFWCFALMAIGDQHNDMWNTAVYEKSSK